MTFARCKILITGGREVSERLLERSSENSHRFKVIIYSRDELKQWELQQEFPVSEHPQLRFLETLEINIDCTRARRHCYSCCSIKQAIAAEYNPMEFIKTNVLGADNLVKACSYRCQKVVALVLIRQRHL